MKCLWKDTCDGLYHCVYARDCEIVRRAASPAIPHVPRVALPSLTLLTSCAQVMIMSALRHPNVALFMGVCIEPPCLVSEWCARGSLYDVLTKARSTPALAPMLDWTRRLNMALDAAKVTPNPTKP